MLKYTLIFLLCAVIAAVFGFNVLTGTAALVAKACFALSLLLLAASLLYDPKRLHSEI